MWCRVAELAAKVERRGQKGGCEVPCACTREVAVGAVGTTPAEMEVEQRAQTTGARVKVNVMVAVAVARLVCPGDQSWRGEQKDEKGREASGCHAHAVEGLQQVWQRGTERGWSDKHEQRGRR